MRGGDFINQPYYASGGNQNVANSASPWEQAQEWMKGLSGVLPQYQSMTGSDGKLLSEYTLNAQPDVGFKSNISDLQSMLSGINLDTRGLEALRGEALRTGPSAWAGLMNQKQGVQQQASLDQAAKLANAGTSSAFSQLAQRGGASRGARERIATKGGRDLMTSRQNVARQGVLDRLGIATTDEGNRLQMLQSLPGAEVQALSPALQKANMWSNMADSEAGRQQNLSLANRDYSTGVQKTNLQSLMANTKGQQDYNMTKFQELMKGYGAERTAQAQEEAGGVSWICTEVHKLEPLPKGSWPKLGELKEHCLKINKKKAKEYLSGSDGLLEMMKRQNFDFSKLRPFVLRVVELTAAGKLDEAAFEYEKKVDVLKKLFGIISNRCAA